MHSRTGYPTTTTTTTGPCRAIAQPCRSSSSPSLARPPAAIAARQALMPTYSESFPILRAAKTAIEFSNAARVICSSGGSGAPVASGGASRLGRNESLTVPRATVQESSTITVVESNGAGAENGASILVDRSCDNHPSDYIGFGSLLENGSFFRERFVIRFSEAGPRGNITLETLSSLLQEAATNHVVAMNYEFTPGKNLDGNITVITRMHIEVDRYPSWRDLLEVDTWFQREGKSAVRRDWIMKDVKTGQNIVFATSTWVLMNTLTRRLSKLTEEQWGELEPHMRHPARWALSEERRDVSSKKISKLGDDSPYKISGLIASEKDTDMNQHVNNIRYMTWMLESIPEKVKGAYEVSKITLEYRQEAGQGQAVESLAHPEEPVSSSTRHFTHLIKTSDSEIVKEINRGRTVWRPLG